MSKRRVMSKKLVIFIRNLPLPQVRTPVFKPCWRRISPSITGRIYYDVWFDQRISIENFHQIIQATIADYFQQLWYHSKFSFCIFPKAPTQHVIFKSFLLWIGVVYSTGFGGEKWAYEIFSYCYWWQFSEASCGYFDLNPSHGCFVFITSKKNILLMPRVSPMNWLIF